jgi:transposase
MGKKRSLLQKINGLIRQARVPTYLHHFGPKKFTSLQHVKCWLLKEKIGCSWDDFMRDHIMYYRVDEIPEVSTLKKFVKRLPFWIKNKLVSLSAGLDSADYGAIDSTGLSRTNASQHYVRRIDRTEPLKKSLKLSLYTTGKRILAFKLRSEWCGDTKDVSYLTNQSLILPLINCMDKGYDANYVHEHFRDLNVYSIIPARKGCRRGIYRKEMRDYFDYSQYWERNCAEWNNSSLKRRFGDYVRSDTFRTQHSEVAARIILHNIISFLARLFHQSHHYRNLYK